MSSIVTDPTLYIYYEHDGCEYAVCTLVNITFDGFIKLTIKHFAATVQFNDSNEIIRRVKEAAVPPGSVLMIKFINIPNDWSIKNGSCFKLTLESTTYSIQRFKVTTLVNPCLSPRVLYVDDHDTRYMYRIIENNNNGPRPLAIQTIDKAVVDKVRHLGPISWYALLHAWHKCELPIPIGNYIMMYVDKNYELSTIEPNTHNTIKFNVTNGQILDI